MKKLLFKDVKNKIEEFGYRLINDDESDLVYKTSGLHINIVDINGYKYFTRYFNLIRRSLSLPCAFDKSNPYTLENISLWIKINNKNFELYDNNIYNSAKEKLNFYCFKCENNFQADWSNILNNKGCGVCSGLQVTTKTSVAYLKSDLIKEFLYSENNKKLQELSIGSHENVYWCCSECNHKWWAKIYDRSKNNNSGCPSCSRFVVSDKNRLSIINPKISSEWHPIKNNNLTPNDVSFGSDKKVWWLCSKCKHEWKADIVNRNHGRNCPKCADEQRESKVATELKEYILNNYKSETEYKIIRNPKNNRWLPYDIYIYDNIFVEIHGEQHYIIGGWCKKLAIKNKRTILEEFKYHQNLDKIKKEYAEENGIYIEIDLRVIKNIEQAIEYVENILK